MFDPKEIFERRINNQHLIEMYDRALAACHRKSQFDVPSLRQIVQASPKYRYAYIEWLIGLMSKGALTSKDMLDVDEYLYEFDHLRRRSFFRVSGLSDNIVTYKSLAALKSKMNPLLNALRQSAWREIEAVRKEKQDRERTFYDSGEARLIAARPGFKVVQPFCVKAARYFEDGAGWCTNSQTFSHNYFYRYAIQEDLLDVLIEGSDEKYGLSFDPPSFVDKHDGDVTLEFVLDQVPGLEEVLQPWINQMAENYPETLYLTAAENQDEDFWYNAVTRDGLNLRHVPEDFCSQEICDAALESNGAALEFVPYKYWNDDLFCKAVTQNGLALSFVPHDSQTEDLCGIAIKSNGQALQHVPDWHKTHAMCFAAVENDGLALKWAPSYLMSPSLCRAAISKNGMALQFLPEEERTRDLCALALLHSGLALAYVPSKYHTEEMYMAAVKKTGSAIQFVPKVQQRLGLCRVAVQTTGKAIKYVPRHLCDWDMCLDAVKQDPMAVFDVPERFRNMELYFRAVLEWRLSYQNISEARNLSFPVLPQAHADDIARAIGIRFNPKTGELSLAPVDMDYAQLLGVAIPPELQPAQRGPIFVPKGVGPGQLRVGSHLRATL